MTTRRIVLKSLAAGALAASSLKAIAADKWPQRPVKIAVPFAAGGNTDGIARLIGQYLTENWARRSSSKIASAEAASLQPRRSRGGARRL